MRSGIAFFLMLTISGCGSGQQAANDMASLNSQEIQRAGENLDYEALVDESDDLARYQDAFMAAAQKLIADGECTAADFREMGGFVKSQNRKSEPIYFTYCGGFTLANRVYLNAETGAMFR